MNPYTSTGSVSTVASSIADSGASLDGPVIVEEAAASTVVAKGQRVTVDVYGNLIIETEVQE